MSQIPGLAEFILANIDPILREWDAFARTVWPEGKASPLLLRDHAEAILRAAAKDMATSQTTPQQIEKSRGEGAAATGSTSAELDAASKKHAVGRVRSGFDLIALVAEYRALRASVIRLWEESMPALAPLHLRELTRFNESIDQSLGEAVRHFSEEMDRSREMFLGILGHDLRNPLNAIIISAQALAEFAQGDGAELADQITSSGRAMGQLLEDFLDFTASRLGRGIFIKRTQIDLTALCREVVAEAGAGLGRGRIYLDLAGDLKGEWDLGRLRQLLTNLLGNAVQHGSVHSPILVSAIGDTEQVIIKVQNSGEPIDENSLLTIFDPLIQGATAAENARHRPGSMGLGLYIAREIATAHRGRLTVESSARLGTIFTVSLPR